MPDSASSQFPQGVSLIIPCYNEENAIAEVLDQTAKAIEALPVPYEIIVVDDGSKDRTADKVDTERFRLIRHPRNMGYGAALKTGQRAATYDCVFITDADGTYPNERIPELYDLMKDADMIVGARVGENVHIPLARRPAKWFINQLANYLSGHRIPDLNSGFRCVRREVWRHYESLFPNGFSLTTTITLATLVDGLRVKFHPIPYHRRVGASKIKPIRDTLNFIQLIFRTILYFDPLKIFLPISLLLFLLGACLGLGTLALNLAGVIEHPWDVTTALLILGAIQMLAIGGLADLIVRRLK